MSATNKRPERTLVLNGPRAYEKFYRPECECLTENFDEDDGFGEAEDFDEFDGEDDVLMAPTLQDMLRGESAPHAFDDAPVGPPDLYGAPRERRDGITANNDRLVYNEVSDDDALRIPSIDFSRRPTTNERRRPEFTYDGAARPPAEHLVPPRMEF